MPSRLSMKLTAIVVTLSLGVSGCATRSSNIAAQQVSSIKYETVDCRRLMIELDDVNGKLTALSESQNSSASGDAALMAVGLVLFWPALLALPATGGGKVQEQEISRLKGEKAALEKSVLLKNCGTFPGANASLNTAPPSLQTHVPENPSQNPVQAPVPQTTVKEITSEHINFLRN